MLSHRQATQTVAGVVMVSGSGEDSMTDMDSLNPTTPMHSVGSSLLRPDMYVRKTHKYSIPLRKC